MKHIIAAAIALALLCNTTYAQTATTTPPQVAAFLPGVITYVLDDDPITCGKLSLNDPTMLSGWFSIQGFSVWVVMAINRDTPSHAYATVNRHGVIYSFSGPINCNRGTMLLRDPRYAAPGPAIYATLSNKPQLHASFYSGEVIGFSINLN